MSDLIDTTEMYLRTVYELVEEGIVPLRARIAERLGHSGPTVSQTVARMERDGLVHVSGDRHLELTEEGKLRAMRVMRKHRLAERLLTDVIGLEWELVHDEACRWEHVISETVERKLMALLPDPTQSPYGNPIPGLEELGGPVVGLDDFRLGVLSLPDVPVDAGRGQLIVRRLGEPLQTDPSLLAEFTRSGVVPGAAVDVERRGENLVLTSRTAELPELVLDLTNAAHVFVAVA